MPQADSITHEPAPPEETPRLSSATAIDIARRALPYLLAGAAYLAVAIAMFSATLSHTVTRSASMTSNDNSLFAWFLEWPLVALRHGDSLFHSSQMFHPTGINILANTSVLGLGIPLLPITDHYGPFMSLNVALIASPVFSGLAAMWVARRWVRSAALAAMVGALFAFSPLVLVQAAPGHLNLIFLVVPPLAMACFDELFWRRNRSPVLVGIALGLLVIWQFFISTEILTMLAIVAGGSLALFLVVGVIQDRDATVTALRAGAPGALIAVLLSAVVLAYPAYYALAGPQHYSGLLWPYVQTGRSSIKSYFQIETSSPSLTPAWRFAQPTYVGPFLVLTLLGGLIAFWRDQRLRAAVALSAIVAWCALGSNYLFSLWRWAEKIGPLANVENQRFSALLFLPLGIALALVLEHLWRWRRDAIGIGLIVVVLALSLGPLAWNASRGLPYEPGTPIFEPAWYLVHGNELGQNQVLLGFPFPAIGNAAEPVGVQALDHMGYAIAGGRGPSELPERQGAAAPGYVLLKRATFGALEPVLPASATPKEAAAVRSALEDWGVTTVVLPETPPPGSGERTPAQIERWLSSILGPPAFVDGAWVWHLEAPISASATAPTH